MTLDKRPESIMRQRRRQLQRDPNALIASAAIMTGKDRSKAKMDVAAWQALGWGFYDTVGELRFGTNWLANAMSRVNLVAATPPAAQGDEPTPIDLEANPSLARAVELVAQIAGGVTGQGQLLSAVSKQLTVPGVGYILATADDITDSFSSWRVLSNDEARRQQGTDATQVTDAETGEWYDLKESDLLIKVWRSHPRRSHEPDSPVRAVLGVLGEIELLSKRIAADARSRLAGNGLLVLPMEVEFPAGQGQDAKDGDEFIQTFMQVTQIPISDQESPAATTPLAIRVPGDYIDKIRHITFYSDFDINLEPLRQAAIKRLALGLDMPPEVLLGMGSSNHWSAWQIAEEAITLQIEPVAETVCHALTIGFLRAALAAEDLDPDSVIVWYDTTDLAARPDKSAVATEAHKELVISDDAYLGYIGLDASDKPLPDEIRRRLLIGVAQAAPAVALELLVAAGIITSTMGVEVAPPPFAPAAPDIPAGDPPPADGPPARAPSNEAAAALLAAADGLVVRALERAGSRLRGAAGKANRGGAATITCDDPTILHTTISATEFASLDYLLEGAWARVPDVAGRYAVNPMSLVACLDGYVRGLLASGHAHDFTRLSTVLGADDDDRHLEPAH